MVHGGFPVLKGEMALLNTHLDSQGQPGLHDCCLLVMEIDSLCCGRQKFQASRSENRNILHFERMSFELVIFSGIAHHDLKPTLYISQSTHIFILGLPCPGPKALAADKPISRLSLAHSSSAYIHLVRSSELFYI